MTYYIWIVLALVFVLLSGAVITLFGAWDDQKSRKTQLLSITEGVSSLLDSEVAISQARLIGLATSPLLLVGDIKSFHSQMQRTPMPEGTLLAISNRERQLANTLRPYGTELPKLSAYKPQPMFYETLESKGFYISSRVFGPIAKTSNVTVSIRIPLDRNMIQYILTTVITDRRMLDVMRSSENLPPNARVLLMDAMGQQLVSFPNQQNDVTTESIAAASGLTKFVVGSSASGIFRGHGSDGVVTAYFRSPLSGWTVALAVDASSIDRPVNRAIRLLVVLAGAVVALVLIMLWVFRRDVGRPYQSMQSMLTDARSELSSLIGDMANARTEEQTRIAQELHDTTAQKLVAAGLYLDSLDRRGPSATQLGEVRRLIAQSLEELRTFAFLLHSPKLNDDEFHLILSALIEGFASRAQLSCDVKIEKTLDRLDFPQRRALYRVTQEALANIHRHAQASRILARGGATPNAAFLVIEDDGRGGVRFPALTQFRSGLGITGMGRHLADLGGSLSIVPKPQGTRLTASLPLKAVETKVD